MKFIANKDLINAIDTDDKQVKDRSSVTAKEFMTKNVIFLSPDDELSKLVKLLNEKDINRIPIVDKGKLVGIITRADVVSIVSEYLSEHPLLRKKSLEIDEPSIETNIDKLLDLVREEGSIKFKKAAKKFNVSEKRIEEWAETLEEYKLVKLKYPPIGDPKIAIIKEKKHAKKK
jgi:signal-transduction protein with cAMP-binding, CBS, and nucleotidyltransferase domain